MTLFRKKHLFAGICLAVLFPFCNNNREAPSGIMLNFNFAAREVKTVRPELQEISGIFYLGAGEKIAAVNDEDGKLFIVDFASEEPTRAFDFGNKGDYEDIAADNSYYYILQSRGRIYRIRRDIPGPGSVIADLPGGDNDFETMYVDKKKNKLVVICKSCRGEEKNKKMPAFCFDLETMQPEKTPCFTIDMKKVKELAGDKYLDPKPSAAAIHPVLNKLFVLCSVGKVLVICDTDGGVEEVFRLDPAFFPQPEGITFAANGDMFISNEGQDQLGTIIRFPFAVP